MQLKMHLKTAFLPVVFLAHLFSAGLLQATPTSFLAPRAPKAAASPTPAKTEWVEVSMTVAANGRSASLTIPGSASRLVVERKGRNGKWSPWMTSRVKSATTTQTVRLPKSLPTDWRARAEVPTAQQSANRKYPAAFYKGARAFDAVAASGYVDSSNAPLHGLNGGVVALAATVANDSAKSFPSTTPVEADIWKTDGTTVYFFNQLRGLQVIDLADPAKPSLISTLRLPSVGQDLYVLPTQGDSLHAVLLTRDPQNWSSTIVQLVRITGGMPSIISTQKISGWLSDSRMAGNNLYLATQNWTSSGGSWSEQAILTQVTIDTVAGSLAFATDFQITGSWPVISAGVGWMAVATTPSTSWNNSDIALFSFDEKGLSKLNITPIQTAGRLYDKFKMQVKDGVFTTISQGWQASDGQWAWWGTQVTQLENFSTLGEALGSLEIIRGETLYATRFAGDKAYAVTFFQTDPLWVIDLSDSANPVISGHLEVPGWSTYIEPLGDLLFAIGVDSGRVEASLFDVADPANPTLASRIQLSETWGYSEALYNEKALKILPEENLALIPFSSYGQAEGEAHSIQLVEWNLAAKTLAKRGAIQHDFEPRRSAMVGGALASISQRQLITANITNRDNPQVLADLLLAWPVNRLALKGDFLLEIADGSAWWDSQSAIRVATAQDPDSILEEASISSGCVIDAVVRGDRLYVAREIGMRRGFGYIPMLRFAMPSALDTIDLPALAVDVYDVSKLPTLALLGTSKIELPANETAWSTSRLLFPSDNLAVLVSQPLPGFVWCGVRLDAPQPFALASKVAASALPWWDGWWKPKVTQPARAVAFDFTNPAAPTTSTPIALTEKEAVNLKSIHAAAGLVVYGFGREAGVDISEDLQSHSHRLGILDLQNPASPALRPSIDLPGRLAAASDISREGFLVWTDAWNATTQSMELQASACDLSDVYKITTLALPGAFAVLNRDIFIAGPSAIKRHSLSDAGIFQTTAELPLDWSPSQISLTNETLLGGNDNHVLAVPLAAFPSSPIEWETDLALDLQSVVTTPNGDLLAPAGEYGVDRF
jgi:hypothetical protein